MPPQSAASITTAHLRGAPPTHRPHSRRPRTGDTSDVHEPENFPEIILDDSYYESGLWPPHRIATPGLEPRQRQGSRADRTLKTVDVSIPPTIGALDYDLVGTVARTHEEAVVAVARLEVNGVFENRAH
ncbi:hypothetical protein R3Q06_33225 [Rhodococcus erythropolis]|uniref:hypothetical protein n=1 Tax=Rhodococcus erythropolis TaxID=1833 RepID=UPI00294A981F|nr:hypothetical protein [Rhodococcus erythropolis]MDV6278308.1 hypothetical protein [Rhodococcus erythropolis]